MFSSEGCFPWTKGSDPSIFYLTGVINSVLFTALHSDRVTIYFSDEDLTLTGCERLIKYNLTLKIKPAVPTFLSWAPLQRRIELWDFLQKRYLLKILLYLRYLNEELLLVMEYFYVLLLYLSERSEYFFLHLLCDTSDISIMGVLG